MAVYRRGAVYWVRFQFRGQEIRLSAHTRNKATAQEYETELREQYGRIARGDSPRVSFIEAVEKFKNEYFINKELNSGTQKRYLTSIISLIGHFGEKYIDEINRKSLVEYVNLRGKKARKDLDCLSSLMTYMVDCELLEFNPLLKLKGKLVKQPKARVRYLDKKEYKALLGQSIAFLKPFIIFAKETGLRREEQFSLQWPQVDMRRREITLIRTKTDTPRVVPLNDVALALMSAQRKKAKSSYVFCDKHGRRYDLETPGFGTFRTAWMGALRRAAIAGFTWHDLRHTFASWAIKGWHDWQDKPMPIERLRDWLGHSNIHTTLKYAHLNIEDLHDTINRTKTGTNTGEKPAKRGKKIA